MLELAIGLLGKLKSPDPSKNMGVVWDQFLKNYFIRQKLLRAEKQVVGQLFSLFLIFGLKEASNSVTLFNEQITEKSSTAAPFT